MKQQYVVLTNDGNLYHAAGQDDLNNLMDNVDAGKFYILNYLKFSWVD